MALYCTTAVHDWPSAVRCYLNDPFLFWTQPIGGGTGADKRTTVRDDITLTHCTMVTVRDDITLTHCTMVTVRDDITPTHCTMVTEYTHCK